MNYREDKNSGSRGSTALLVLAGLVLLVLWCQVRNLPFIGISDTSVTNQLRDLQSSQADPAHAVALSQSPTRRIGALASEASGDGTFAAFNSTSVPAWCPARMPLLAITCSTNEPLYRILQWIRYHQMIGFSLFYFFVEGKASEPEVVDALRQLVGVKVFMQDEKLKWWHVRDRSRHEHWLRKFFGQPCNGELFVKQSINMAVAVHQARVDGAAWIGHIDTDELLYPASTPDYSMHQLLDSVPMEYHSLVLPNYEALPEREGIVEPAREVTLFKVAVDHIDRVLMQQHYKGVAHGNPNYFIAYSNGKSLARVLPGLRPHGAHRWSSYNGTHNPYTHQQASVLHYTYNRFSDLTGRKDRCECAPTTTDARRCFWLSFDQQAFVAASLKTEDELRKMFRDRLVWEDPASIALLRSKGLLTRIYGPQLMIRSEASRLIQSVPRRPSERVLEDAATRAQSSMQHPFAFAADTMAGPPTNCAEFLAQDSSVNILELMGPVPEPDDKTDSDATLIARMTPMYDRQEHQHPVVHPPPV